MIGAMWAHASGIGPVIGGAFTERVRWRWCFSLNPESFEIFFEALTDHAGSPLQRYGLQDTVGVLECSYAKNPPYCRCKSYCLARSLEFPLGFSHGSLPDDTGHLFIIGIFYFAIEASKNPVIPLALFNKQSNAATLIVAFCRGFILTSVAYFIPVYF